VEELENKNDWLVF